MTLPNQRIVNALGAAACAGMIAYALYEQYVNFLEPCPLCSLQRLAVIALGFLLLGAAIQNPGKWGGWIYGALISLVALAGIGVAGWHIRLQNLPADEVPACGPGLEYMLETLPLTDALAKVFQGSGECATIDWTLLGLSMPAWVLIAIAGVGGVAIWNNLFRSRATT